MAGARPLVTFDLFSALLDSRQGGGRFFERLSRSRGWPVAGGEVHDCWDRLNKAAQQRAGERAPADWVPFRDLCGAALEQTYAELRLDGDAHRDAGVLVAGMARWPPWPDVAEQLPVLARSVRIGVLSNVDDDILARTRVAGFVDAELALTSQRLRAYKPAARMYTEARRMLGPMVHVATSARDVRGALEAGVPVVRLLRPGHQLDPDGPTPPYEADGIADLAPLIARAGAADQR